MDYLSYGLGYLVALLIIIAIAQIDPDDLQILRRNLWGFALILYVQDNSDMPGGMNTTTVELSTQFLHWRLEYMHTFKNRRK